ncbi:MAG: hypothetical protein ABTA16_17420, partial [Niallia sp.]
KHIGIQILRIKKQVSFKGDLFFTKTDNFLAISPINELLLTNPVYSCGFPRNIPLFLFPILP